ncbi:MAG: LysR family transcriptional regulator [Gemmobacter sp.]
MNLRQLSAFVAIHEEGSFSRAAERLAATQSGLSMQIRNMEERLGLRLFERTARGVTPTEAGRHLYGVAVDILHRLDAAEIDLRNLSKIVSGPLAVGLMPTFTRGVLAPVLSDLIADHPDVTLRVIEGYSALLVEMVAAGELDFAVVPHPVTREGLRVEAFGRDREILVMRAGGARAHLAPAALAEIASMKLVLPLRGNARRDRLEAAFAESGLVPEATLDMDAMIATLDFVARSDYATILPATICTADLGGAERWLHPIVDPALSVNYALISPATRAMSPAARAFLDRLRIAHAESDARWARILSEGPAGRRSQPKN